MNALKRNIPNIITLINLFCGLCSIIFAFDGNLGLSGIFIFYGAFFDFLDGLAARLLKVSSKLGKQLDSMADMVTFGIAPGLVLFQLIYYSQTKTFFQSDIKDSVLLPTIIAFLLPIFSAIRLAKYNLDTRQTSSFIGLPTPVAAIFVASLPLIAKSQQFAIFEDLRFLIVISVILPLLLVVEMPLFSLKFSKAESLRSRLNIFRISLIVAALILFFAFGFAAIPFIVILYLILSLLNNIL
jgi:CDP-diacylglycerol--serine O-phosphatidyltransferase|tara:strand:+ start:4457 stop:5179 length:723 start_codon:yes stop_codon:yes gene_type:complete